MSALGEDPLGDPKTRIAFEGVTGFAKLTEKSPVPLVYTAVSTPGYKFVSNLSRQYLRSEVTELAGEAVIFGKVQRILREGEQYEAFSLLPALSTSLPNISKREQRKIQREMTKRGLAEVVKGPAIILSPVAVYR